MDRVIRAGIAGMIICCLSCHFIFVLLFDGNIVRDDE